MRPIMKQITKRRANMLLRFAAVLALLSIALMTLSIIVPRPMPIILSMSAGQAIGTLATMIYVLVVVWDLRRKHVLDATATGDIASITSEAEKDG